MPNTVITITLIQHPAGTGGLKLEGMPANLIEGLGILECAKQLYFTQNQQQRQDARIEVPNLVLPRQ